MHAAASWICGWVVLPDSTILNLRSTTCLLDGKDGNAYQNRYAVSSSLLELPTVSGTQSRCGQS